MAALFFPGYFIYCSISNGSSRGSMGYDFVAISFCFIQSAGGIEKIPDSASA
ncbi:hypothetical protein NE634_15620 [Lacrimispora saccharolytica]|nr:hypothetical protein [Lacrimispora saccharolytica]